MSEACDIADPVEVLPPLCAQCIISWLDAKALAACCALNRAWRSMSEQDILWKPLCEELWSTKSHVPAVIAAQPSMRRAYVASLVEADRNIITEVSG